MRNCVLRLKVIRAMQESKRRGRGVRRTGVGRRIKWDSQGPWEGGGWANTGGAGSWAGGCGGTSHLDWRRGWSKDPEECWRNGMEASEAGAAHVRRRRWMESKTAGWQLGCAAREIRLRRVFVVLLQFIYSLWLHSMWNISSQDQGSNTQPLHWKCKVSATGPAGKSCLRFAPYCPSWLSQ